ncbi:MAG: hypothetical protein WAN22_34940 [Solirubrobacteraceae bacterium]
MEYKGIHREQWLPNRLTWLFFHDEAVAFAAGHRPCALCRRSAYDEYCEALSGSGSKLSFDEMDRQLHRERLKPESRRRKLHDAAWSELPDGVFVLDRDQPAVVSGRELVAWDIDGYRDRRRRPRRGTARMITPPSTLEVLQAGYSIQLDETARQPATR